MAKPYFTNRHKTRQYARGGRLPCPPGTQWNGEICGPYPTGDGNDGCEGGRCHCSMGGHGSCGESQGLGAPWCCDYGWDWMEYGGSCINTAEHPDVGLGTYDNIFGQFPCVPGGSIGIYQEKEQQQQIRSGGNWGGPGPTPRLPADQPAPRGPKKRRGGTFHTGGNLAPRHNQKHKDQGDWHPWYKPSIRDEYNEKKYYKPSDTRDSCCSQYQSYFNQCQSCSGSGGQCGGLACCSCAPSNMTGPISSWTYQCYFTCWGALAACCDSGGGGGGPLPSGAIGWYGTPTPKGPKKAIGGFAHMKRFRRFRRGGGGRLGGRKRR